MRVRSIKFVGSLVAVMVLFEIAIFLRRQMERFQEKIENKKSSEAQMDTQFQDIVEKMILPKHEPNNKRWLTVGIPTVEREKRNYFFTMLESLLEKTPINHLDKIYVVVFLADIKKGKWKDDTEMTLKRKYSGLFKLGTLKVIRAPIEIYSGMDTSFEGINISHWRIKQNYDYAFMMQHCQNLSEYYIQMEDDVITADGYIDAIEDYIKQQDGDEWICLEFSELGFIGKLYHSRDLKDLAQYLLLLRNDRPVDINNDYYYRFKGQKRRLARIPTLFQHIGYHSSLPNRIQPLTDRFFQENIVIYSSVGIVCIVAIVLVMLIWMFRKCFSKDIQNVALLPKKSKKNFFVFS